MDRLIAFHHLLLNDPLRMNAYRQAIHQAVQPGDVVLDLGTGSGILSLFACQAGAARVYAVDKTEMIALAKQLAWDNGYGDRVVWLQQDIRDLTPLEPVDVIVSELISKAVIGQQQTELVSLCRDRFLQPHGRIIPQHVQLVIAPVESAQAYRMIEFPAPSDYGLDFSRAHQLMRHQPRATRFETEDFVAAPQTAYGFDMHRMTAQDGIDTTFTFEVVRTGRFHGYAAWFEARLSNGVELTNRPPGIPAWDNLFFPLWEPVDIAPGQRIQLRLKGRDIARQKPFWFWATEIRTASANATSPRLLAAYRQSTFWNTIRTVSPLRPDAIAHELDLVIDSEKHRCTRH